MFDARDTALVRSIAPALAEAARHGLLLGQAGEPDVPEAPGLVVIDRSLAVESATPTAARWLEELGGTVERPPASLLAVAGHVLGSQEGVVSRVLSAGDRWLVLHGAVLSEGRASVIVDAAQPAHLESLLMRAYALTSREQEITRLVLRGESTVEIATRLSIAPGTVQTHLTGIFEKTGVRSRRELTGLVFQRHYEPRVRDNERRTSASRPSRDGPMASA